MSNLSPPMPSNRLLASLPAADLQILLPQLRRVDLPFRHIVQRSSAPITSGLFVETGFVSMVVVLKDGDGAEVGLIGSEGMVGLPLVYGSDHSDTEGIVQGAGWALQIDAEPLREAFETIPSLRHAVLRYALVHHQQVARTAACNGRHHTEQRLARWLLMAHDRADSDRFVITHELLSIMLAVRRAGVTVAAGNLQRAGLIRYDRGHIEITNRRGLEAAACECYAATQMEIARVMASPER